MAATIGEVFPPEDEVAQFVLVLCAQRDDLSEAMRQLTSAAAQMRNAMHYYHRIVVSHYFEAVKWLAHALTTSDDVAVWLDGLPEAIHRSRDNLLATSRRDGLARRVLWAGRATTFHYPQVGVDRDGLRETIEKLSKASPLISGEPAGEEGSFHPRLAFADEVMTFRMFEAFGQDVGTQLREIKNAVMQYVDFADACLSAYRDQRALTFR